jgi:hypothetical protein
MRCPRQRTAAALSLVVSVFLLAGCGLLGEQGSTGGGDTTSQPVNGGKVEPGQAEPRQSLASQDITIDNANLHVAVHELARRGRLVELTFSVTRTDDGTDNWQVGQTFGGPQSASTLNVSGVELVDTVNAKLHTVALDGERRCVCSGETANTFLKSGDSVLFSATYAAPPENVEAMGVRIPRVGTFNDVPLS